MKVLNRRKKADVSLLDASCKMHPDPFTHPPPPPLSPNELRVVAPLNKTRANDISAVYNWTASGETGWSGKNLGVDLGIRGFENEYCSRLLAALPGSGRTKQSPRKLWLILLRHPRNGEDRPSEISEGRRFWRMFAEENQSVTIFPPSLFWYFVSFQAEFLNDESCATREE